MMKFISQLGFVSKADYDRERLKGDGLSRDLVAERAKFRKAATDLAAQADEIASLRPDAEAMRRKRANDIALKREKREAARDKRKGARS